VFFNTTHFFRAVSQEKPSKPGTMSSLYSYVTSWFGAQTLAATSPAPTASAAPTQAVLSIAPAAARNLPPSKSYLDVASHITLHDLLQVKLRHIEVGPRRTDFPSAHPLHAAIAACKLRHVDPPKPRCWLEA
jgi:hypothetical protein